MLIALQCPRQSPDLNPTEHLWGVVKQEIHIMDVQTDKSSKVDLTKRPVSVYRLYVHCLLLGGYALSL